MSISSTAMVHAEVINFSYSHFSSSTSPPYTVNCRVLSLLFPTSKIPIGFSHSGGGSSHLLKDGYFQAYLRLKEFCRGSGSGIRTHVIWLMRPSWSLSSLPRYIKVLKLLEYCSRDLNPEPDVYKTSALTN